MQVYKFYAKKTEGAPDVSSHKYPFINRKSPWNLLLIGKLTNNQRDSRQRWSWAFVGICLIAGAFGIADALVQGGIVGDLSLICPEFMQSFFAGMAASGAMTSALRLITKAAFENASDDLRKGVPLSLAVSAFMELLCFLLYAFYVPKLPIVKYYMTKTAKEGSKTVIADLKAAGIQTATEQGDGCKPTEPLTIKQLLRQNIDYCLDLYLIHVLTLSIFPGVIAEDTAKHQLGSWYTLVLIAMYNALDLVGRYIPLIECLNLKSRSWLMITILSGFLLVPVFYFTAKYGDQGCMIFLTSFLGLTNGYLTVCVMTLAPKGYKDGPQSGRTVIWVGNPVRPIPDRSGVVTIAADGNLILSDGNGSTIWMTRVTVTSAAAFRNTAAVLSETGNLILSPESSSVDLKRAYWQSFNDQTDTFVPGMQVLVDASARPVTNDFTSWRSEDDPYPGKFTMGVDPQGGPQIVVWENRQRLWRTGMWNGEVFTGLASNSLYGFNISSSGDEDDGKKYLSCVPKNADDLLRCMDGFEAVDLGEWRKGNWSGGCQRITPLVCGGDGDEFRELRSGKLPDFANLRQELVDVVHRFNGSDNVLYLRLANSHPEDEMPLKDVLKNQMNPIDIPLLSFGVVQLATNHFSVGNKLGEGGFGPVYKGTLSGGEEIAVKRLSRISGQGFEEFKNEINVIAKLQHRNLVRLLGYCVQEEEKMVVYEYMSNKSLDFFLFDPTKQAALDWGKRLTIIEGIARGLLYLHRDSRLRVIHRDLKASNVLLDDEMNPKISDFGMARIFGGNPNEAANTIRVVGTYGYMSPEYAMEGLFSVKSDVYSFGVLVLEIAMRPNEEEKRRAVTARWVRPRMGAVKVNTDVEIFGDEGMGVGEAMYG
uniref:non-specific serine/threonine protein kinase n=1 Tax=Linum usitatissimum TaxID=4006 RepID=I6Y9P6_LINUS|nr:hypothetical protein [Linum usitatissimum]